jgi:hypothetical protein
MVEHVHSTRRIRLEGSSRCVSQGHTFGGPDGYRPAPRRGAAPTAQSSGQPVSFNPANVFLVAS